MPFLTNLPDDPIGGFVERPDVRIWRGRWTAFTITAIDPDGPATGGAARVDIAPTVADHETLCRIHAVPRGSLEDQAGLRLAARAVVAVLVIADQKIVHRQIPPQ